MFPNITPKYCFLVFLWIALNSFHSAIAQSIKQPIIVFAVTDCEKAYLIRVFENGKVEYRGAYGVKTLGQHESKITQEKVKDLLKQIEFAGAFSVVDDQIRLSSFNNSDRGGIKEAIYLRQGHRTATFFHYGLSTFSVSKASPLFFALQKIILKETNAERWVNYTESVVCWESDTIAVDNIKTSKLKLIKN
jgi:hypothetical protein